jgi:rare lipoprotein A
MTGASWVLYPCLLLPLLALGQEPAPSPEITAPAAMPGAVAEPAGAAAELTEAPSEAPSVGPAEAQIGEAAEEGRASWYGRRFAGRRTACGRTFDPKQRTLAHPSLPCGTRVRVTNLSNGRSVEAEVTDRGPFTGGRIADLSRAAACELQFGGRGTLRVRIEVIAPAGDSPE